MLFFSTLLPPTHKEDIAFGGSGKPALFESSAFLGVLDSKSGREAEEERGRASGAGVWEEL